MRFRIRARNPKTQQAHDFQVEGVSIDDARRQVTEAGLDPSSIEPAAETEPSPDETAPSEQLRRRFARRPPRRYVNVALMIVLLAAVGLTVRVMLSSGATTLAGLDATIRYDGFQFWIANNDDFAWQDVRLDLNGGLANSGYLHRPGTIVAGQTHTMPVTAFADEAGNRFDPVTDTPRQLTITCDRDDGQTARYTKRWN
jgi:hypothetical protein